MNSKTRNKIITDLIVAAATVTLLSQRLTGNTIHEWLGVAALAAVLTHLLLSFDWIAGILTLLMGLAGFFMSLVMNVENNREVPDLSSQPALASAD